jgi:glycosyltransferase involved in cell wall biosynthesis
MLGDARLRDPRSVRRVRRALAELLLDDRPDVAICHLAKPLWLFGPVLRRLAVPTVFYLHGPVDPRGIFDRLVRWRRTDLLIGVSEHTLQTWQCRLRPVPRNAVINYPMPEPTSRFDELRVWRGAVRAELETPENAVVVAQATRMNPWKGHRELIEALALLRSPTPWVAWIIGGPQNPAEAEYFDELRSLARSRGLAQRVRFLGQRDDPRRLLAAADIYCQANVESEGFSLSFIDAFSAMLPVVTTDIGSAREVVPAGTGVLTPLNDANALASALGGLVDDAEKRLAMGREGRRWVSATCDTDQQIRLLHSELARLAVDDG